MILDKFINSWNTPILYAHNIPSLHDYIDTESNKHLQLAILMSIGTYVSSKKSFDAVISDISKLEGKFPAIYIDSGGFQYLKGTLKKKDIDKHTKFYFDFIDYIVKRYSNNDITTPIFIFSLDIPGCRTSNSDDVVDNESGFNASYSIYEEIARRYKEDPIQRQILICVTHFSTNEVYSRWKKIYSIKNLNLAEYVAGSSTQFVHKKTVPLGGYNVLHMLALRIHGFNNVKLYHLLGTRSLDRLYPIFDVSRRFNIRITHDSTPNFYYRDIIIPIRLSNQKYRITKLDPRYNKPQIIRSANDIYRNDNVTKTVEKILDELANITDKEKLRKTNLKASSLNYLAAIEAIATAMTNKVIDNITNDIYAESNIDKLTQYKLIDLCEHEPEACEKMITSVLDKFVG